jgi:hypothetical protein
MSRIERVGHLDAQIEHRLDLQRLATYYVAKRLPPSNSMAMKVRPSASSIS